MCQNDAAAEYVRVVRCPEIEEVGPLPSWDDLPPETWIVAETFSGSASLWRRRQIGVANLDRIRRWCLPGEPWRERERRVVRRWTAETVPQRGTAFAWYTRRAGWVACHAESNNSENGLLAEGWNERGDYPILAWLPLPTVERAP